MINIGAYKGKSKNIKGTEKQVNNWGLKCIGGSWLKGIRETWIKKGSSSSDIKGSRKTVTLLTRQMQVKTALTHNFSFIRCNKLTKFA